MLAIIRNKKERSIDIRQVGRAGAGRVPGRAPLVDILDQRRARSRSVASPQLDTMVAVVRRKVGQSVDVHKPGR